MNAKKEIINERIRKILFSPKYAESLYSVFIELWNGNRFRLTERGASYADVDEYFDDLRELNISELPHEYFIGQFIKKVVMPENDYAYIILGNNWKIGVENEFNNQCFYIETYKWYLNDDFYDQSLNREKPTNPYLSHQQIINYFLRNGFGTELPVLTHFSVLQMQDRIYIIESLIENGIENIHVYDKLSMAYAKKGNARRALEILENGLERGFIDTINYSNMIWKIKSLQLTNPTEYIIQKEYINNSLKEANTVYEKLFLKQIEDFVEKNYSS